MPGRSWWLGAVAVIAAGLVSTGGCSSETSPAPAGDASADTSPDVGDASVDAPPDVAACVSDADLGTLTIPDAAINDAGASTSSCLACLRSLCPTEIAACNGVCECRAVVVDLLDCVAKGGQLIGCFVQSSQGLPSSVTAIAQSLGLCAFSSCPKQCGAPASGDAGPDGRPTDGSIDAADQ